MTTLAANVLNAYRNADPKLKREGHDWYPTAAEVARNVAAVGGLTFEQGAAVVAALSPRTQWSTNVAWAYAIAEAHAAGATLPRMGLGNNLRRAAIAVSGDLSDINRMKGTLKVYNFYGSIIGRRGAVCIDTHAVRIAEGNPTHKGNIPSDGAYERYADAYREAARTVKRAARDVQAATWVDFRGAAH